MTDPLAVGDKVLDRYRVVERLETGGTSVVYRGEDERLSRPVCIKVFHYRSARDRNGGTNLGLFTPRAFSSKRPGRELATWVCYASRQRVDLLRKNLISGREKLTFPRSDFEVGGILPAPAV